MPSPDAPGVTTHCYFQGNQNNLGYMSWGARGDGVWIQSDLNHTHTHTQRHLMNTWAPSGKDKHTKMHCAIQTSRLAALPICRVNEHMLQGKQS